MFAFLLPVFHFINRFYHYIYSFSHIFFAFPIQFSLFSFAFILFFLVSFFGCCNISCLKVIPAKLSYFQVELNQMFRFECTSRTTRCVETSTKQKSTQSWYESRIEVIVHSKQHKKVLLLFSALGLRSNIQTYKLIQLIVCCFFVSNEFVLIKTNKTKAKTFEINS